MTETIWTSSDDYYDNYTGVNPKVNIEFDYRLVFYQQLEEIKKLLSEIKEEIKK